MHRALSTLPGGLPAGMATPHSFLSCRPYTTKTSPDVSLTSPPSSPASPRLPWCAPAGDHQSLLSAYSLKTLFRVVITLRCQMRRLRSREVSGIGRGHHAGEECLWDLSPPRSAPLPICELICLLLEVGAPSLLVPASVMLGTSWASRIHVLG